MNWETGKLGEVQIDGIDNKLKFSLFSQFPRFCIEIRLKIDKDSLAASPIRDEAPLPQL